MAAAIGTTPTNCCCGLFTLHVGVKLITLYTIAEGIITVWFVLVDRIQGTPFFRWGLPEYELWLQVLSVFIGVGAIFFGVLAIPPLKPRKIFRFKTFQGFMVLFNFAWFLIVGIPKPVSYVEVPAIQVQPISRLPGVPRKSIVDPAWPNGKPHVCQDVFEMKLRWATWATASNAEGKTTFLMKLVKKLLIRIFQYAIPCSSVLTYFWIWGAMCIALRAFFVYVLNFYWKVVLHGGNGRFMYGDLEELDVPMGSRKSTKRFVEQHIRDIFKEMDKNHDGSVSVEEFLAYMRSSSDMAVELSNTTRG